MTCLQINENKKSGLIGCKEIMLYLSVLVSVGSSILLMAEESDGCLAIIAVRMIGCCGLTN